MTWWQKALSGFNTPQLSEEELRMGKRCPKMIEWLEKYGFQWQEGYGWWQRVWFTPKPSETNKFPPDFEEVYEIWVIDLSNGEWTYRIVNPICLAPLEENGKCYAQHGGNWELYVKNAGTRE